MIVAFTWFSKVSKLLTQIFNDREETTSELMAEVIHQTNKVERLKEQLKLASDVYSTDKMHMYQELKAKDKEIERLKASVKQWQQNFLDR